MSTLLIRNISALITCDDHDSLLENVDLYAEDGVIQAIGPQLDRQADTVLDGSHMLCYPGLVNTHHHLYQVFSRNLPQVQNMELFDWLKTLYEIWKHLDADVVRLSSLTGMGELMKHGCTTCFDHHYVFPANSGDLLGAQLEAAGALGVRMACSRGSMDLSKKDGGLPPDSVVQTVDEIMRDSVRCIEAYHDPSFGSMHTVALAPCSPFSVSAELLRQSAILARQYGVRLHTHLCETKDEENFMLAREGVRPLAYMEKLGWLGSDVWFAHGIHFNDEELRLLAQTGAGVAHCPISNMKLASGVARIPEMLALGVPVGLAVVRLQRRLQPDGGAAHGVPAPPAPQQQGRPLGLRRAENGHPGQRPAAGPGRHRAACRGQVCRPVYDRPPPPGAGGRLLRSPVRAGHGGRPGRGGLHGGTRRGHCVGGPPHPRGRGKDGL